MDNIINSNLIPTTYTSGEVAKMPSSVDTLTPASYKDNITYLQQLMMMRDKINEVVDTFNLLLGSGGSGYVLPIASNNVIGGVKGGGNVEIGVNGEMNVEIPEVIIPEYEEYILPKATKTKLGGIKAGENVEMVDGVLNVIIPEVIIPEIPEYEEYILPQATDTILGGVTVGEGLYFNELGQLCSIQNDPIMETMSIQETIETNVINDTEKLGNEKLLVEDGFTYKIL